jgi:hypothetical protein
MKEYKNYKQEHLQEYLKVRLKREVKVPVDIRKLKRHLKDSLSG